MKGVDYVNSTFDDNDFLVRFINEVRNPKATVDSIVAVFKSFSDNVVVKKSIPMNLIISFILPMVSPMNFGTV